MKKSSLLNISIILMFFYAGFFCKAAAQGLRNEGATINVASGCYVICQGGIINNGTITNNGNMTINGGVTNSTENTIEGGGTFYVGGSLINNGTFTQFAGTTTFNGAMAQTISGSSLTTFNNLIIDASSAGTTIAAGTRVTVAGSAFSPNGKLTINSEAVDNNGSLIYTGSGIPLGNITYSRTLPGNSTTVNWHYVSSPAEASSPAGSFYGWNETTGLWDENPINTTTYPLASGRGYTLLTNGNAVSFSGSLQTTDLVIDASSPYKDGYTDRSSEFAYGLNNNGDIWAPDRSWIDYGGGGFNLMGNPYTSAINVSKFTVGNSDQFDPNYVAVYLYDGNGYWFIGSPIGGWVDDNPVSRSETHIQTGQGFFVLALNDGSTFTFTRNMQEHDTDVSLLKSSKSGNAWPGLRLQAKYGDFESSTQVVYNEQMTTGLDPGYDVGQMSSNPDVEIFTALVLKDNSVNFARQALPIIDCDKIIIPVGIDTEKGGAVTFSAYTVPIGDNKFWLEDRTAGIFTNLNANTYTVTLPANTYGTGRFFIITSTNTPTGINELEEEAGSALRIWTYDGKVIIKGAVSEGALCEIYDTGGRKVRMTHLTDGELNTVTLPSGTRGVYLVRVIDGVKVATGKVALL